MQLLALPSGLRPSSVDDGDIARLRAAKVLGVFGLVAYNWWVVVPFVPGVMPSVNGFFSDLEATGRPHAALMSDADLAAGILLLAALLLRGSTARQGVRVSGSGWWASPWRARSGDDIPMPVPRA